MALEDFAHYEKYLHQGEFWPSASSGSDVYISRMPPRHALACLQKLVRWSKENIAYLALNISATQQRETYVRSSTLGRMLAYRAGLIPAEGSDKADERSMVLLFAPILAEHTDLDITTIFATCEALAKATAAEWTVLIKSR